MSRVTGRAIDSLRMVAPNGVEIVTNPIENEDGSRSFIFAVITPERLYAAADPIVGPAFDALAKALQKVQP